MSTGPPQGKINDSGFTVLQDAVHNPEVDIIFVHGLQGHPKKTWSAIKKADQDTPASKETKGGIRTWFSRLVRRRSGAKEAQADCKKNPRAYPKDLLSQERSCASARIMTCGYDSDIIKLVNTANFSTISGQAETLLNAVARVRQECQRRPLIFITHSLGRLMIRAVRNIHTVQRVIAIFADRRVNSGLKLIPEKACEGPPRSRGIRFCCDILWHASSW